MSDVVIKRIVVHGRVQGVGYRAFVEHEALQAGVGGWVRNRRDGTVEAVLQGSADVLAAVVEACRRGPFAARVDEIMDQDAGPEAMTARRPGELFSVLPTA